MCVRRITPDNYFLQSEEVGVILTHCSDVDTQVAIAMYILRATEGYSNDIHRWKKLVMFLIARCHIGHMIN